MSLFIRNAKPIPNQVQEFRFKQYAICKKKQECFQMHFLCSVWCLQYLSPIISLYLEMGGTFSPSKVVEKFEYFATIIYVCCRAPGLDCKSHNRVRRGKNTNLGI